MLAPAEPRATCAPEPAVPTPCQHPQGASPRAAQVPVQQHRSCNARPCNAATSATPVPIRHRCPCAATSHAMPVPVPSPLPRWPPRSPPATPRAPSSPLRPWVPLTARLLQRHPRDLDPRVLVALGVQVSPHHLLGVLRGRERWGGLSGAGGLGGRGAAAGPGSPYLAGPLHGSVLRPSGQPGGALTPGAGALRAVRGKETER